MQQTINIIILSKDRACQLDLLLRSMDRFFHVSHETTVLVAYNQDFKGGYGLLKTIYPSLKIRIEQDFKSDICELIQSNHPFTLFLCDDHMFRGDIYPDKVFNKMSLDFSVLSLSLRLGRNITKWHDVQAGRPQFIEENQWLWQEPGLPWYSWAYPMSLPSHVYRTEDLKDYIPHLEFTNPNELEGAMAQKPINKPYMLCFDEGKIAEMHMNKVQTANNNRCGKVDAEILNGIWLTGWRLDIDRFLKYLDPQQVQFFDINAPKWIRI